MVRLLLVTKIMKFKAVSYPDSNKLRAENVKGGLKGDLAFFAVILRALSTPEYTVTAI